MLKKSEFISTYSDKKIFARVHKGKFIRACDENGETIYVDDDTVVFEQDELQQAREENLLDEDMSGKVEIEISGDEVKIKSNANKEVSAASNRHEIQQYLPEIKRNLIRHLKNASVPHTYNDIKAFINYAIQEDMLFYLQQQNAKQYVAEFVDWKGVDAEEQPAQESEQVETDAVVTEPVVEQETESNEVAVAKNESVMKRADSILKNHKKAYQNFDEFEQWLADNDIGYDDMSQEEQFEAYQKWEDKKLNKDIGQSEYFGKDASKKVEAKEVEVQTAESLTKDTSTDDELKEKVDEEKNELDKIKSEIWKNTLSGVMGEEVDVDTITNNWFKAMKKDIADKLKSDKITDTDYDMLLTELETLKDEGILQDSVLSEIDKLSENIGTEVKNKDVDLAIDNKPPQKPLEEKLDSDLMPEGKEPKKKAAKKNSKIKKAEETPIDSKLQLDLFEDNKLDKKKEINTTPIGNVKEESVKISTPYELVKEMKTKDSDELRQEVLELYFKQHPDEQQSAFNMSDGDAIKLEKIKENIFQEKILEKDYAFDRDILAKRENDEVAKIFVNKIDEQNKIKEVEK